MATTRNSEPPKRYRGHRKRRSGRSTAQPVPLHRRSSAHFSPAIRELGAECLAAGKVELEIEPDGERARARVHETDHRSYGVGIDWSQVPERRALHAFCECRRFAKGTPCEHIWAALLAFGETGPQAQPMGRDRVSLRKDGASAWDGLHAPAGVTPARQPPAPRRRRTRRTAARQRAAPGSWRSQIDTLRRALTPDAAAAAEPGERQAPDGIRFLVNTQASLRADGPVLDVFSRRTGPRGRPGKLKRAPLEPEELERLLLPEDAPVAVVAAFAANGARPAGRGRRRQAKTVTGIQSFRLPRHLVEPVLAHLSAEGLLGWWDGRRPTGGGDLEWETGEPWRLALHLDAGAGGAMRLHGALERDDEQMPLSEPLLILPTDDDGRLLVVGPESISPLAADGKRDHRWISQLRATDEIVIPADHLEQALTELFEIPDRPPLEIPEELQPPEKTPPPRPRLVLRREAASVLPHAPLLAELSFRYGDLEVSSADARPVIGYGDEGALLRRDMELEHQALIRLLETGVRPVTNGQGHELELRPQEVPAVAEPLLLEGWEVEVSGTSLRAPDPPKLRIESGIDWFELAGGVDFAGDEVDFKSVLEAVSKGDRFVELADGSRGLLPSAWSETYDSLAKLAHDESDDGLRFLPSQALLVDSLLIEMPAAAVDQAFAELRDKLRSFDRIKPKKEPRGFAGTLRAYQRDGLGWLIFLREYGLGGVLADDMGLGKTVQVLALLRAHRTPSKTTGLPWLVVVPRSLLYNWIEEASRFTPKLKVVEYGGPGREALQPELGDYDLVVTTYGTLRRDVGFLARMEFDTVVLDEAQAIKNRESLGAKASRLLVARHRLALTGTPIENHLGELGSLMEFLNPGLLGRLPLLEVLASGRAAGQEELEKVARGVRPFILRRTKAQVLPDLPPKTEQVLHCTLNPRQREIYDQLKAGYQASLLQQVESEGVSGSALQVLEALLRLRQIACHPGLVNETWEEAGSSKLETLLELVDEVLDEGHKLIVFSQFTKLLAYVRRRLDERSIEYAYLDGQTRKRGEVVERFQTDPSCNLFLISLKAGGVGLNLTAAGYVFLLDPWWNPAVEAQAIDRAHRIGQTQPVFAYRLIASDTVEEKILKLQSSKRKIADTILDGEAGSVGDLTADDLRMLLS